MECNWKGRKHWWDGQQLDPALRRAAATRYERTSCTSFVRCNDMWLAKDNRFLNPMSTYERNLMAPTCLIINFYSNPHILGVKSRRRRIRRDDLGFPGNGVLILLLKILFPGDNANDMLKIAQRRWDRCFVSAVYCSWFSIQFSIPLSLGNIDD